jgi:anaerobic magnesium-protoporphyrin IX monomethyl ester cyclase
MTESIDILFINPGDWQRIYQALGDEFSAIEPPVFAGLFATFARKRGYSTAIYDVPAWTPSAERTKMAHQVQFKGPF